jgi:hypothetical protein
MGNLIPNDLMRRAELFNEIVGIVAAFGEFRKSSDEAAAKCADQTPLTKFYPPTILIINHRIICNGISVDLSRRPAVLQLVRLFLQAGTLPLSREDILIGLYGHLDDGKITRRYRDSLTANVVKSVSRTRNFLNQHFSEVGIELDWLVYDAAERVWHLYRPR